MGFVDLEATVTDLAVLVGHYDWLLAAAEKVSFAQNGKIAQSFGVITEVVYARSGLNIGAKDKDASYTLGGTVKGLHALVGEKGSQRFHKSLLQLQPGDSLAG